jgi:hypothetical protein
LEQYFSIRDKTRRRVEAVDGEWRDAEEQAIERRNDGMLR